MVIDTQGTPAKMVLIISSMLERMGFDPQYAHEFVMSCPDAHENVQRPCIQITIIPRARPKAEASEGDQLVARL